MQRTILKTTYWIAIITLCLWATITITINFFPFEFSNQISRSVFERISFSWVPIIILLTLTGTIKYNETRTQTTNKIVLTVCASFLSVIINFMMIFSDMCSTTTTNIFFINKQNNSIKIVERSFGCGAWDSSPATISVSKVREITPYLIWVSKVDTNKINKNEWVRIQNKEE
ncbi:MAG: hypothetical protein HYZ42_00040 [Bacteroidetes bacterium]|nr:hypothetical protein [Bacteroidota bacterium]